MAKKTNGKKNKWLAQTAQVMIFLIFVLFVIFFVSRNAIAFVTHAQFFRLKEIVTAPSLQFIQPQYLENLKGESIFDVDLNGVQKRLQAHYPQINNLRIVRRFPDRIYILARKREPFAYLSLGRQDVFVDKEGVVISPKGFPDLKLPVIKGIRTSKNVGPGTSLRGPAIDTALDIINAVQTTSLLNAYPVSSVDVTSLSRVYLYLGDNLRVIVDHDQIEQKMKKLGILLTAGELNLQEVKYIDLRFEEPILGKTKV